MVQKLFYSSTLVGGSGLHHHLTTRKMADLNLSIGLCLSVLCFFHLLSWLFIQVLQLPQNKNQLLVSSIGCKCECEFEFHPNQSHRLIRKKILNDTSTVTINKMSKPDLLVIFNLFLHIRDILC